VYGKFVISLMNLDSPVSEVEIQTWSSDPWIPEEIQAGKKTGVQKGTEDYH
jgi:hypothetical protein